MIRLHGFAASNYFNMAKLALLEKGVDFEINNVHGSQDPAFLAMSPRGKVPVLETDKGFLNETNVILEYIEETQGGKPLLPSDPYERGVVRALTGDGEDARQNAELTELLAGGEPSSNAWRRDANSWTFDTWFGDGDIDLVLDDGAALAATPHGIFMAVGEDRLMPSTTDLFAYEGGTMWGEIFMVNDESSDPAARLRDMVENDTKDPPDSIHPLWRVLRHEEVHAQQWARYGYSGFIARYLWHNPWTRAVTRWRKRPASRTGDTSSASTDAPGDRGSALPGSSGGMLERARGSRGIPRRSAPGRRPARVLGRA